MPGLQNKAGKSSELLTALGGKLRVWKALGLDDRHPQSQGQRHFLKALPLVGSFPGSCVGRLLRKKCAPYLLGKSFWSDWWTSMNDSNCGCHFLVFSVVILALHLVLCLCLSFARMCTDLGQLNEDKTAKRKHCSKGHLGHGV